MAETGDKYLSITPPERLVRVEAKVRALESSTERTFNEVKQSVAGVTGALKDVDRTLTVINERMVTQKECRDSREVCNKNRDMIVGELHDKVDGLELSAIKAEALRDATNPRIPIPQAPEDKKKSLPAIVKEWAGVIATAIALGGFGTVATCANGAFQAMRGDMQASRKESVAGQQKVEDQLTEIREAQPGGPLITPMPAPVPVVVTKSSTRPRNRTTRAAARKAAPPPKAPSKKDDL